MREHTKDGMPILTPEDEVEAAMKVAMISFAPRSRLQRFDDNPNVGQFIGRHCCTLRELMLQYGVNEDTTIAVTTVVMAGLVVLYETLAKAETEALAETVLP